MIILALVGLLLVLLLLRVPIAFSLLIPSILYVLLSDSLTLTVLFQKLIASLNSFPLVAIPLFLLMGVLAEQSGATERLFRAAEAMIGHFRASLGYVSILVSFVFAWMSGSAVSDAAALGKISVPEMVKRNYDPGFAIGLTAGATIIAPIMPPSIPAVVYAVTAGVSLGGMLIAGVVPAIVIAVCLAIYVYFYGRGKEHLRSPRASFREIVRSAKRAALSLLTPVILVGGILTGIFTPTEAAAIAAVYMVVLCIMYGKMNLKTAFRLLRSTAETTGAIMLIVACGGAFSLILTYERAGDFISDGLLAISTNPIVVLLLMNVILLLVGMFIESTAAILVMVPILLPTAVELGVDPLHFGAIVILNLMIGLLTPPVGLVLYVMKAVTNQSFKAVVRGTVPVLIPLFAAVLIVTLVPDISSWLPDLLGV